MQIVLDTVSTCSLVLTAVCVHRPTKISIYKLSFPATSDMASNTYGTMTIPMLKEELRKKGARLSGRKHELIERYVWAIIQY